MNHLLRPRIWTSSRPSPVKRDASRDPDNVPEKAGNQTPNDVIELSLDSGYPPSADSGMTESVNSAKKVLP